MTFRASAKSDLRQAKRSWSGWSEEPRIPKEQAATIAVAALADSQST